MTFAELITKYPIIDFINSRPDLVEWSLKNGDGIGDMAFFYVAYHDNEIKNSTKNVHKVEQEIKNIFKERLMTK